MELREPEHLPVHQRPWVARLFGVLGPFGLPLGGLPASLVVAIPAIPLKRPSIRLPMTSAIAWWSLIGALACVAMAGINATTPSVIAGQIAVMGILIFAYQATISTIDTAAILIGWLAGAMTLYMIGFGPPITQGSFEMLWKFGIAYSVTTLTLYVVARVAPTWVGILVLLSLGALGTLLNFRSFGLVCAAAAAIAIAKIGSQKNPFRAVVVAAVYLGVVAYALPKALESGVFGVEVMQKTMSQSGDGPLILGGRTEPPLSIAALAARPFFGWGNTQMIDSATVNAGVEIAKSFGMYDVADYTRYWVRGNGTVSLHSMLFVPWVEGGILAAVAPILLMGLFIWAAIVARGKWALLVTLVSVQSTWDILFSPWTGDRAVATAAGAILAAHAIMTARSARTRDLTRSAHRVRRSTAPSRNAASG